jgi:hypothetical protein
LKVGAFFSLQIFFSSFETQQLTLGTGTAIWWVTEPHLYDKVLNKWIAPGQSCWSKMPCGSPTISEI